ncbi:hypothetical protein B0H13DRAFT_1872755 [Mycena leptocephala]|nr:hypothetical protein B0H13DRAFT_1872755 [Mycena leptocephala]
MFSDGPLARYLGDLEIDAEEGARYTANRQWDRASQVSDEEKLKRITRGKFSMDLVCPFLEFYSQQDGIKGTDLAPKHMKDYLPGPGVQANSPGYEHSTGAPYGTKESWDPVGSVPSRLRHPMGAVWQDAYKFGGVPDSSYFRCTEAMSVQIGQKAGCLYDVSNRTVRGVQVRPFGKVFENNMVVP